MSAPSSKRLASLFLNPPLWILMILAVGIGVCHHVSGYGIPSAQGLYTYPLGAGIVTLIAVLILLQIRVSETDWGWLTVKRVRAALVIMTCAVTLTFAATLVLYSKLAFAAASIPCLHAALRKRREGLPSASLPVARIKS